MINPGFQIRILSRISKESRRMDRDRIEQAVKDIIIGVGEDPGRPGLVKTPGRVRRAYEELLSGYGTDPRKVVNGALYEVEHDDMVVVSDVEFYSLCEHHMLPFFGFAYIAYVPNGKVIGLSKIPRLVEVFAHRLQLQERMTSQIADCILETIAPQGVAVVTSGQHLCSMMRGVKKSETRLVSSCLRGVFENNEALQQRFFSQIRLP
jgi:GTP cyclohydrolase IA